LLVPRHPPCALKNLPQILKMLASTMQFSSYHRNPPPNPAPTPHPTRTPTHVRRHEKRFTAAATRRARPPTPTAGARSLRTQQRAKPPHPPAPGFHPGRNQEYYPTSRSSGQLVDVPPMSNHLGTRVRAVALDPTTTPNGAAAKPACSLERR